MNELDNFAQRLEHEMYEFRLAVIYRICVARGIKVDKEDCASALVAADGRLALAISHLIDVHQSRWHPRRLLSMIRRVLHLN